MGRIFTRPSSLCVHAPCTDTPRTQLRGLDVGGIFLGLESYARSRHAFRCVTAGQHQLPYRPRTRQKEKDRKYLHRSEHALRCAPAGIGHVARGTARVKVSFAKLRSLARSKRGIKRVKKRGALVKCTMRAERAEKPRAAFLLAHSGRVVGISVALPRRLSRGNYTHARADILSRAILVYELDCYIVPLEQN